MKKQVERMWMDKTKGGCAERLRFWKLKQIKEKLSLEPTKTETRFFRKDAFPFVSVWATARAPGGAQQHRFGK